MTADEIKQEIRTAKLKVETLEKDLAELEIYTLPGKCFKWTHEWGEYQFYHEYYLVRGIAPHIMRMSCLRFSERPDGEIDIEIEQVSAYPFDWHECQEITREDFDKAWATLLEKLGGAMSAADADIQSMNRKIKRVANERIPESAP